MKLVLAIIALASVGWACTVVYTSVEVGPNFRAKVEGHGRPVKGLRVVLGDKQASADTDKDGLAFFRAVRPGSYFLSTGPGSGILAGAMLEVKLDGPGNATIPLKVQAPVSVRSLKGTMRRSDYLPGQQQPGILLDLVEASSGRRLKGLQTTDRGEFDFERVAPGLYFMSVKPSENEPFAGLILVVVDDKASTDHMDLDLGRSSCGLHYTDRNRCRQGDIRLNSVSGRAVDADGATIGSAKILLTDPAGTAVEQILSDAAGNFASSLALAGTYEMVVTSAGLAPLRGTNHVGPAAGATLRSHLMVQLGVFGECGTLR